MEFFKSQLRAHHYKYAYPGLQQEGIRHRIRQGVGGPVDLEPGAQIHGHLHLPVGYKTQIGETVVMNFKDQKWRVQLDHTPLCSCRSGGMIRQNEPGVTGHEVEGTCIHRVE